MPTCRSADLRSRNSEIHAIRTAPPPYWGGYNFLRQPMLNQPTLTEKHKFSRIPTSVVLKTNFSPNFAYFHIALPRTNENRIFRRRQRTRDEK